MALSIGSSFNPALARPTLKNANGKITLKPTPRQARHYTRNAEGIDNETRVFQAFSDAGSSVRESSESENITLDIDGYFDDVPVSIKTQDAGVYHGHIYVELTTQIRPFYTWKPEDLAFVSGIFPGYLSPFGTDIYGPAWYYTGKAEQYVISQKFPEGRRIRVYDKAAIADYVKANGFVRVLGLSRKILESENGRNSICGYMEVSKVPFIRELWAA